MTGHCSELRFSESQGMFGIRGIGFCNASSEVFLCRKTLLPQNPVAPKRITSQVTNPCKSLLCAVQ